MKKLCFLLFILVSLKTEAQQIQLICKTVNVSFNPNFPNLNCPIEICVNQSMICDTISETNECNYSLPQRNCSTFFPSGGPFTLCYYEQISSSSECNCELVTNSITVSRLKYDGHGNLVPIESLDFYGPIVSDFMNILKNGTPSDLVFELTKDCEGNEIFHAPIRISGTGNPQNPFIVLIP